MQKELIELALAAIGILLVLFVLRRASIASRKAAITARERLGMEEEAPAKRVRKRARPGEEAAPTATAKPRAKPAIEPSEDVIDTGEVPEGDLAPADADATAAYKAGLAKTRGGFVARLGKLFGKKKIDATTLEELEEVLFTADIGPRAADRIFQAVKTGLSKTDLEAADKIWAKIRRTSREE